MYRPASVGLFGLPISPLRWQRPGSRNQSTALRIFSACLPSFIVLPSMSRTMPPKAVMVVGYWPPLASQWPSRCWVFATQASPLLTTSLMFGSRSWAKAERVAKAIASIPSSRVRDFERFMIGSSLLFDDGAAVKNLFRFRADRGATFGFRWSLRSGRALVIRVQG